MMDAFVILCMTINSLDGNPYCQIDATDSNQRVIVYLVTGFINLIQSYTLPS